MPAIQIRKMPQKIDGPFQIWNDYKCMLIDFKDETGFRNKNKISHHDQFLRSIEIKTFKFFKIRNIIEFTINHNCPVDVDDKVEFIYGTTPKELEHQDRKYNSYLFPYYYPKFILQVIDDLPKEFFYKIGYQKGFSPPFGTHTMMSCDYVFSLIK